MISEILEQPEAIRRTLDKAKSEAMEAARRLKGRFVYTTGSGSSYHASLVLGRTLMKISGSRVISIQASELPDWLPNDLEGSALVAFSQSGESKDVLTAVRRFRELNPVEPIIGITNTPASTLAKLSDQVILTRAGEERAIAATKSYTTQLAASFLLSVSLASIQGREVDRFITELELLPEKVNRSIDASRSPAHDLAFKIAGKPVGFVLGKGPNYPTALEAALKLRETSNLHYVGYAAREFLHGPIQLVDRGTPVIFLNWREVKEVVQKVSSFGGEPLLVGEDGDFSLPPTEYEFSPVLMVIPMQLLSYEASILRGLDPDRPEKLSKVVRE
ncbi:MAG: SIS domain-containing protein [Candidatus Korarchaeota archaeon]|nr:SIS domain-containing protein [Candidatus Korarchaeota archaeon]